MTDIVERLRKSSSNIKSQAWEAADEIMRLRSTLELMQSDAGKYRTEIKTRDAEIERLRAYANHERSLGAEGPMIDLAQVKQELADAKVEIERLRADKDIVRSQERNTSYERSIDELEAENERLKAQLKALQDATKDLTLKVLEDLKQRALEGKL